MLSSKTLMLIPDNLTSRSDFERRVYEAIWTIDALPDRESRFLGDAPLANSVWREARNEWDAYGSTEARTNRFQPTRAQVADCMEVLGWCAKVDKQNFQIVRLRSYGLSYEKIADKMRLGW